MPQYEPHGSRYRRTPDIIGLSRAVVLLAYLLALLSLVACRNASPTGEPSASATLISAVAPSDTPELDTGEWIAAIDRQSLDTATPQLALLDPVTGKPQVHLSAPGLMKDASMAFVEGYVFYATPAGIVRLGYNGNLSPMPFTDPQGNRLSNVAFLPSGDGSEIVWEQYMETADPEFHFKLVMADVQGVQQRIIYEEVNSEPLIPVPVYWSKDTQFLYITHALIDGEGTTFNGGLDLYKIDTETRSAVQILAADTNYYDLSISPDGSVLAYSYKPDDDSSVSLVLRNLTTEMERQVVLTGFREAGNIIWSPDGLELMCSAVNEDVPGKDFAIAHIETRGPSVLHSWKTTSLLRTALWPARDTIFLLDNGGDLWQMDAATGDYVKRAGLTLGNP